MMSNPIGDKFTGGVEFVIASSLMLSKDESVLTMMNTYS